MTATILLIRHAAHDHLDHVLSGRTPGIGLSAEGRAQADKLARRLAATPIDALHASPIQRAQETALAIAASQRGIPVTTTRALEELDFGEWAGCAFAELERDPRWETWNCTRESATAPGGESMLSAQSRAWEHVERAGVAAAGQTLAMVTHCDIIRAVIAKVLGLTLNHIHRFDIGAASVSRIVVGAWGAKVLSLNEACQ